MRQETINLRPRHHRGMALLVKQNESANPGYIRLLGPAAIMARARRLTERGKLAAARRPDKTQTTRHAFQVTPATFAIRFLETSRIVNRPVDGDFLNICSIADDLEFHMLRISRQWDCSGPRVRLTA